MKIAYMHFHLKTGGVTTVIRQQVEAMQGICDTLVLSGSPPETGFPGEAVHVTGIGYDDAAGRQPDPGETAAAVIRAIRNRWKAGCDILHVHNPTLAKNRQYLNILKILKDKGIRLFLQIHDFAEDGRPGAYFKDNYVANCHYGVINARDYDILIRSGLKPQALHLVGNMVTPLPAPAAGRKSGGKVVIPAQTGIQGTAFDQAGPFPGSGLRRSDGYAGHVLYPIRAIRRKNIGEAILLALFFPENRSLYITLPPNSPADFPAYDSWKRFTARFGLNVEFEAGLRKDFISLVHAADSLLTTSISEGFGFSFMEPWTAGKFLWGRDLPGITDDFKKSGIRLDHLYSRLRLPAGWVVTEGFFESWQKVVRNSLQGFQVEKKALSLEEAFERLTSDGTIDFGLLNEKYQQLVVQRLIENDAERAEIIALNPFLADCGQGPSSRTLIGKNRELVASRYSLAGYRRTLTALYKKVVSCDPVQAIDKQILLYEFFDLNAFSLLKWGQYDS
jgi:hypothetical protein